MEAANKKLYIKPLMIAIECDISVSLIGESGPPPFPDFPDMIQQDKYEGNSPFRDEIFENNPLDDWNK